MIWMALLLVAGLAAVAVWAWYITGREFRGKNGRRAMAGRAACGHVTGIFSWPRWIDSWPLPAIPTMLWRRRCYRHDYLVMDRGSQELLP
jgi:hypothetical protein